MNKPWSKGVLAHQNYMDKTYMVFDFETTIRNLSGNNPVGSMPASPFHPMNEIWLTGHQIPKHMSTLPRDIFHLRSDFFERTKPNILLENLNKVSLIVGQNVKFDLLYLLIHHYDAIMDFFRRGGIIWDTMQAEYLLTNQQEQFAGLGNKYKHVEETTPLGGRISYLELIKQGMGPKYGGTDKDDKIKEFWDKEIDTPLIPPDMLQEYCYDDVRNTCIVFREQMKLTQDRGRAFIDLISTQMQAIVATTIMEYNGMKFNIDTSHAESRKLSKECDSLEDKIEDYMYHEFEVFNDTGHPIPRANMNANSTKQLSVLLYGGEYRWAAPVKQFAPDGSPIIYKTGARKGQQKMKKELVWCTIIPACGTGIASNLKDDLESTTLGWSTDEDSIKRIVIPAYKTAGSGASLHVDFMEMLLHFRTVYKDLNTYYISLMELMWPNDSAIHGSLNHCVTKTGRLASSQPNMQNLSGAK